MRRAHRAGVSRSLLAFILALTTCFIVFSLARPLSAHPLGMSSVNRYLGVRIHPTEVEIDYLLDLAELPAYAEIESLDADHDERVTPAERDRYFDQLVPRIIASITVKVSGRAVALTPRTRALEAPPGQSGLSTLRVILELRGAITLGSGRSVTVTVNDTFRSNRNGWRELGGLDSATATLTRTSLPTGPRAGTSLSYPTRDGQPSIVLRQDSAEFEFSLRNSRPSPSVVSRVLSTQRGDSSGARLSTLLRNGTRTPGFVLSAILLALVLGAGHALSPGHGKTLVAAYLVGARGDLRHAVLLGLTVTVTHTASVFLLGLFALALERSFGTEKLLRTLELTSGVLVISLALSQLPGRWRRWRGLATPSVSIEHSHGDGESHTHDTLFGGAKPHAHTVTEKLTLRSLVALGVSGGLVPCPGALVLLLSALSLHRVGFGLVLLVAFSVGLATVLTAIGTVFVLARKKFETLRFENGFFRALPVVSSLAVLLLGVVIVARSVWLR